MEIYCSYCNTKVTANNINLESKIAKCASCDNIFSIKSQLETLKTKEREYISNIPFVTMNKNDATITFNITWFKGYTEAIFLTLFSLFWNGFMLVWFSIALSSGQLTMALFGSIHALIGLFLAYYTICLYVNTKIIIVDSKKIFLEDKPLPFFGNKIIDIEKAHQLYTKEIVTYSKNRKNTSYKLAIITSKNKDFDLPIHFSKKDEALYLEQEIEKFLKIKDIEVSGEVAR